MFDSLLDLFERDGRSRSGRRPTGLRARLARLLGGDAGDDERRDDRDHDHRHPPAHRGGSRARRRSESFDD